MFASAKLKYGVIDTSDLLEEAFRLRYQVYCQECHFITEEDYPDGIEKDEFDPFSIEFFARDAEGLIGTARLILDSPLGFPFEARCKGNLFIDESALPCNHCAEISRFAISKEYLNRNAKSHNNLFPHLKPLALGIIREIYRESERLGIEYVYVLMERPLFMLLKKQGLRFYPLGEEIDFYGPVRPYLGVVEELGETIMQKVPCHPSFAKKL